MMNLQIIKNFGIKLKELNYLFGIDFQKPETIQVFQGQGIFTINKLYKDFKLNEKNLNLLITKIQQGEYTENRLILIKNNNVFIVNDNFMRSFNRYYSKTDFERARKKENIKYIVISVNKEQLQRVKQNYYAVEKATETAFKNDTQCLMRIQKYKIPTYCNYGNGKINISQIDECQINNIKFDLRINEQYSWNRIEIKNINDYIDKSGFNVFNKRQELQRQARILKAEKEKNKLNQSQADYKQIAEQIQKYFNNSLIALSRELQSLDLAKEKDIQKLKFLNKILDRFQLDADIYQTRVKNDIANKNFNTLEKIHEVIERYTNKANLDIEKELEKEQKWLDDFNAKYNKGE